MAEVAGRGGGMGEGEGAEGSVVLVGYHGDDHGPQGSMAVLRAPARWHSDFASPGKYLGPVGT